MEVSWRAIWAITGAYPRRNLYFHSHIGGLSSLLLSLFSSVLVTCCTKPSSLELWREEPSCSFLGMTCRRFVLILEMSFSIYNSRIILLVRFSATPETVLTLFPLITTMTQLILPTRNILYSAALILTRIGCRFSIHEVCKSFSNQTGTIFRVDNRLDYRWCYIISCDRRHNFVISGGKQLGILKTVEFGSQVVL